MKSNVFFWRTKAVPCAVAVMKHPNRDIENPMDEKAPEAPKTPDTSRFNHTLHLDSPLHLGWKTARTI